MIEQQPYRIVPASQGYFWVKNGTELLRDNFGRWLLLFLLYFLLAMLSSVHVTTVFIFNVFSPVFWGGIFLAGVATLSKLEWSAAILFEALKKHSTELFKLGLIMTSLNFLIGFVLLSELSALIDFEEFYKVMDAVGKTGDQELLVQFFSDPEVVQQILLSILVAMLVSMPIMMAGWFAPVLIMEKGLSPLVALRLSFQACTANFKAFLIYGLVTMIMALFVIMSMYIALLFVGPLFFTSYYVSYEDIFPGENKENSDADESNTTMIV